ncbi:MAG: TonB system transport protein ExbD [Helicobacteraceae bacterium]|nr:TonB system transport protein ExbD [Helicobacteraceae bacterium]
MKKMKKFDQVNVIPFIDIMLVLLVMVLTTTTFVKQGIIPVDLPSAQSDKKAKDVKEITINITKNGDLYLAKDRVNLAQLEAKLKDISKEDTVILRSDKEAEFQNFVSVMDLLKKLQLDQLYIVTKE